MSLQEVRGVSWRSAAGVRAAFRLSQVAWVASRRGWLAVFGGSFGSAILVSLEGLWAKLIIDGALERHLASGLIAVGLLAASMTIAGFISSLSNVVIPEMAERMYIELQERVLSWVSQPSGLAHLESQEYMEHLEGFQRLGPGELSTLVGTLAAAGSVVVGLVVGVVLLISVYPALPAVLVLAIVPIMLAPAVTRVVTRGADDQAEPVRLFGHLHKMIVDDVSAAREMRIYGATRELSRRAAVADRAAAMIEFRTRLKASGLEFLGWLPMGLAYGAGIVVAAILAAQHQISLGNVVLALAVSQTLNAQLSALVQATTGFARAAVFVQRYEWIQSHSEPDPARTGAAPDKIERGIRFEGVSFRYPGATVDALTRLDLDMPAGSVIALVGENGAGKTTIVKLLCGFYDPTEGTVTVDGQSLGTIQVEAWRRNLTAVLQDFINYRLLLRENVGVGNLPEIDNPTAIRLALANAEALDMADELPDGLETQLGQGWAHPGHELSGGQWQKLAVARMQMRNQPLLVILDEPTGALDAETEEALFRQYANFARHAGSERGAITVLVSHRFSTVRMADHIAVIEGGRATEQGTHDELMEARGRYAEMYTMWADAYS